MSVLFKLCITCSLGAIVAAGALAALGITALTGPLFAAAVLGWGLAVLTLVWS